MRPYWQGHWQKAESNLRAARLLLDAGEYAPCIGCAYFAAFHAAITALLKWTDYRSKEWRHKTVQAEFAARLVHRRKMFTAEMVAILPELLRLRNEAAYSPDPVSADQARRAVRWAEKFVGAIRKHLGGVP
jgi:uncharacterized protein (UPF0332 family)